MGSCQFSDKVLVMVSSHLCTFLRYAISSSVFSLSLKNCLVCKYSSIFLFLGGVVTCSITAMLVSDLESESEESDSIWFSSFFVNLAFSLFSTVKYWSRTSALELLRDNTLISCLRPLLVKVFLLASFEPFLLAKVKHLSVIWVVFFPCSVQ